MSKTYTTTYRSRATSEFDAFDLRYTDTIHDDGTIDWSVVGIADGERVNERGTRKAECELDWERIHAARVRSGWTLVSTRGANQ